MLNIISRSIVSKRVSGPRKVVENLIKGLDEIGYPYVINARLDACKRVWIHDDVDALKVVTQLNDVFPIVGPNLFVTPRQIPITIDLSRTLYLHPSSWVIDLWKESGFDRAPLAAWPTGIDTNEFIPREGEKKQVLIYFKERYLQELDYITELLTRKNIPYVVIKYGEYSEGDYRTELGRSKYTIWIGRQESQGIALQEALAMNVPILVWDIPNLGHWQSSVAAMKVFNEQENNFTGATSAYYFDSRCGLKTREKNELESLIDTMEGGWKNFNPRAFILEKLSLAGQAKALVMLFETHFHLPYAEGLSETLHKPGKWKNAQLHSVLYQRIKDIVRTVVK
jgi:hypothetical protein